MNAEQLKALKQSPNLNYINRTTGEKYVLTAIENHVWNRMKNTGDYPVSGVGNWWWCNPETTKGALIEAISTEEMYALMKLEDLGFIKHESKTIQL